MSDISLKELMGAKLGSSNPSNSAPKKHKLHISMYPMDDGKFFVRHDYRGGQEPTPEGSEYAPAGIKELHDHIDKHYSTKEEPTEVKET